MSEPALYMMSGEPTDRDKADDYRARLRPLLEQVASIVTEARKGGLIVGFSIAPDQYGRAQIGNIDVTKPL